MGVKDNGVRSVTDRQTSAVDLVLHEVRQSILNGDLAPGRPFTVLSLTERLGVSHVPVREAMRQLESQGLIRLNRSRSAVVTPLEAEDLRAIYRLRLCIEPPLAALSATDRTDRDLDELGRLLARAFDGEPGEHVWEPHRAFHVGLISPAASAWDLRVLVPLWDGAERYTRIAFDPGGASAEYARDREDAHAALLDAVRARDPEAAHDTLAQHLEENRDVTLERLAHLGEDR